MFDYIIYILHRSVEVLILVVVHVVVVVVVDCYKKDKIFLVFYFSFCIPLV